MTRGLVAIVQLAEELPEPARVVAVRRELLQLALDQDHPDLMPLLLLRVGEVAATFIVREREARGQDNAP